MTRQTFRLLLALSRWAKVSGWSFALDTDTRQDVREWRHGDLKVTVLVHHLGTPFPPSLWVWRHREADTHDLVVQLPACDVTQLARVLIAVGVLPADWNRRPAAPAQLGLFDLAAR